MLKGFAGILNENAPVDVNCVAEICEKLLEFILRKVGSTGEGHCPSFFDMESKLGGMGSGSKLAGMESGWGGMESGSGGMGSGSIDPESQSVLAGIDEDSVEIPLDYQLALACCWLCIKDLANLLVRLYEIGPRSASLSNLL